MTLLLYWDSLIYHDAVYLYSVMCNLICRCEMGSVNRLYFTVIKRPCRHGLCVIDYCFKKIPLETQCLITTLQMNPSLTDKPLANQ